MRRLRLPPPRGVVLLLALGAILGDPVANADPPPLPRTVEVDLRREGASETHRVVFFRHASPTGYAFVATVAGDPEAQDGRWAGFGLVPRSAPPGPGSTDWQVGEATPNLLAEVRGGSLRSATERLICRVGRVAYEAAERVRASWLESGDSDVWRSGTAGHAALGPEATTFVAEVARTIGLPVPPRWRTLSPQALIGALMDGGLAVPTAPPAPAVPAGTGAGPATAPPAWAKVSDVQRAEASRLGVPVAFENTFGMRFVLVPAGTFTMGSPYTEAGREEDETIHEVTLTRPFYMQVTEVTNGDWRRYQPAHDGGTHRGRSLATDRQPVVNVPLSEARRYADWLTKQDSGRRYDLPTEAEWEWACRAGTSTLYSWGDGEADGTAYVNGKDPVAAEALGLPGPAWPRDDGHVVAAPVGSFLPNPWGLHDMHGNVWEWCTDPYEPYPDGPVVDPVGAPTGTTHVIRGGDWSYPPAWLRSAARRSAPDERQIAVGFRLVSRLPAAQATAAPGTPVPLAPPVARAPAWAKVSDVQRAEASRLGVPVSFENALGMRFVLVPAGTFTMGSPYTEAGRFGNEDEHEVTLTKPYYVGVTEVTNTQLRHWKRQHASRPSPFGKALLERGDHPAVAVSWEDAWAFAVWLTVQDGVRRYDLPTEAQWEYACRAGTRTRFWWGDAEAEGPAHANAYDPETEKVFAYGEEGWPGDDGHRVTAPVGSYPPNAWGLHDTLGNALEWCLDRLADSPGGSATDPVGPEEGTSRVWRGGSWGLGPRWARSATRDGNHPGTRANQAGFRLVSPLPGTR